MGDGIDEDALRKLMRNHAVREAKVCRVPVGEIMKWSLEIRLGGSGSKWIPIRSAREPLRLWLSAKAIFKFVESVGLMSFVVEL